MSEITCNIIRDLLPSYMDKIASDDSVRLIEAHLAACQECQDFKDRLEKPDFHVAHETGNLDYLKKIRRLADFKSAVCFLLLLITGVFFLEYTRDLHQAKLFFLFAGMMLLCNYLLFFQHDKAETTAKKRTLFVNAVSIVLALYTVIIMQVSTYNWLADRDALFHMDYDKLGPFLHYQMILVMVVELTLWVRELIVHIKTSHFSIVTSSFGIIGFYMSLYYIGMLKSMETLDSFHMISNNALLLFAEGVGILLIFLLVGKVKSKKA